MPDYRLDEPDFEQDAATTTCACCGLETSSGLLYTGQPICADCDDNEAVEQSIEQDRKADEDEDGYGFGV